MGRVTVVGLLAFAAFFGVCWLLSAAVIRADQKDQHAYDEWFADFMRKIRAQ